MGDPARSPTSTATTNFYSILGLSASASLSDIGKAYKFLVMRWHPDKNTSNKAEAEAKFRSINEAYRVLSVKKRVEENGSNHDDRKSPKGSHHPKSPKNSVHNRQDDDFVISSPSLISSTSRRVTPTGTPRAFSSNSSNRRSVTPSPRDFYGHSRSSSETSNTPTSPSTPTDPITLLKMASRRNTTPIIFSQSTSRRKPQPIEKKLECTLEELYNGCVKMVKIARDVISNEGLIVEEEEVLRIRIKPGWKKGTKITFEGKGDEKPGMHPADIIFVIEEKMHPIFKREGDDLELGVEIPLVQALTGSTLSVPLLGGGKINLSLDEIIFPGYEKIIPGQGMPKSIGGGRGGGGRGDLRLRFLVEFPVELSEEQRSDVVSILQDCS